MNVIFKFIFNRFIDPLELPIDPLYEYIILAIIGVIAYIIAYNKVGIMYSNGWIDGRTIGSLIHWFIRIIVFFAMWYVTYMIIQLCLFIIANWQVILMLLGSILGTTVLCAIAVSILRFIKKHRLCNK
jgi:hypothetical protein